MTNKRQNLIAHTATKNAFAASVMLLLLSGTGCQFDPYTGEYTTRKPNSGDVIGEYVLDKQSFVSDEAWKRAGIACNINLKPDGSFMAVGIPPFGLSFPDSTALREFLSTGGTWSITTVGSIADGSGHHKTHWGIALVSDSVDLDSPGLTGGHPPYGLVFTMGDPDLGEAIFLKKK